MERPLSDTGGDRIAVRGIRVWGHHGADPGEQLIAQPLDVDCVLELDLRAAATSDALNDTYDYARLHRRLVALVAEQRCALLERLAQTIADDVLGDARIRAVEVTIAKPGLLAGATPSVTLRRLRK